MIKNTKNIHSYKNKNEIIVRCSLFSSTDPELSSNKGEKGYLVFRTNNNKLYAAFLNERFQKLIDCKVSMLSNTINIENIFINSSDNFYYNFKT